MKKGIRWLFRIAKRELFAILEEQKQDMTRHAHEEERQSEWLRKNKAQSEVQRRIDAAKRGNLNALTDKIEIGTVSSNTIECVGVKASAICAPVNQRKDRDIDGETQDCGRSDEHS